MPSATPDATSLHKSRLLSRYSEQQLCGGVRDVAFTRAPPGHRSSSIQHLPAGTRMPLDDPESWAAVPLRGKPPTSAPWHHGKRGLEEDSPDRVLVGKAQYAKVRRHSEQAAALERREGSHTAARPSSSYRYSVERLHDGLATEAKGRHGGSFLSLDAGCDLRGSANRPVELYLVVRPPTRGGPRGPTGGSSEVAVQAGTDEAAPRSSGAGYATSESARVHPDTDCFPGPT